MYILKNALRSISRSKGRNILIGIITVVIALSSCVALSIRESASKAKEAGLAELNITASIQTDREKLMKESSDSTSGTGRPDMSKMREAMQGLSLTELQKYQNASTVKEFYYQTSLSMNGNNKLVAVDLSDSTTEQNNDNNTNKNSNGYGAPPDGDGGGRMIGGFGTRGDFTLVGASSDNALVDFKNGTSSVTSGTMFTEGTDKLECIITEDLATYNSLKVGSRITFVNPNSTKETYKFKVVGIYKNETTESSSDQMGGMFSASGDASNKIYTSSNALNTVMTKSSKIATKSTDTSGNETTTELTGTVSGTYTFADVAAYNTFAAEVKTLGLSDNYKAISTDIESYEASLKPLNNLSDMALNFFFIVLGIGGIILIVLNIFNIRERKYEIGVLTAMGMKKGKVAVQFVIELFVVTFIAVLIGTAGGAAASPPISNSLLSSQTEAVKNTTNNQRDRFGRSVNGGPGGGAMIARIGDSAQNTNYLDSINSTTNIIVVLELIGVAIILTILSSCAAAAFVMRYEPLKILSNRD